MQSPRAAQATHGSVTRAFFPYHGCALPTELGGRVGAVGVVVVSGASPSGDRGRALVEVAWYMGWIGIVAGAGSRWAGATTWREQGMGADAAAGGPAGRRWVGW